RFVSLRDSLTIFRYYCLHNNRAGRGGREMGYFSGQNTSVRHRESKVGCQNKCKQSGRYRREIELIDAQNKSGLRAGAAQGRRKQAATQGGSKQSHLGYAPISGRIAECYGTLRGRK